MLWMVKARTRWVRPRGLQTLEKVTTMNDAEWVLIEQLNQALETIDDDVANGWKPPKGALVEMDLHILIRATDSVSQERQSEPSLLPHSTTQQQLKDGPPCSPPSTRQKTSTVSPVNPAASPLTSKQGGLAGRSGVPPTTSGCQGGQTPFRRS